MHALLVSFWRSRESSESRTDFFSPAYMYILYYLKKQIPFWTHFDVIYHILLVEIVERKSMYVCL